MTNEGYQDLLSGDALQEFTPMTNGYHYEEFFNGLKTGDCWGQEPRESELDEDKEMDDRARGDGTP